QGREDCDHEDQGWKGHKEVHHPRDRSIDETSEESRKHTHHHADQHGDCRSTDADEHRNTGAVGNACKNVTTVLWFDTHPMLGTDTPKRPTLKARQSRINSSFIMFERAVTRNLCD